ncbi:MAG TPA: hypothetical protein VH592_16770 [Gemmataceae bacterium]|jgi:hypothetical protein
MTHQAIQPSIKTCLAIAALLGASTALVGSLSEPPSGTKDEKTDQSAESKANERVRLEAERVVRNIEIEIPRSDNWIKVPRIKDPLLYYGDPTRQNDRGSVWAWGQKGRPVALLEIFRGVQLRSHWTFVICNTSGGKLRARYADAPWWDENDSSAELKDIPGVPAPAADASLRQRQVKLLAQKFTGHEFWDPDNTRYELRLLKRPLCTYRDEASGILEGGLFTLANGTNPEILFFVEAHVDSKSNSKPVWQYTVGRLAHAELHLEYDGKEVYTAPRGNRVAGSDQPYWIGTLSAALDAASEKP